MPNPRYQAGANFERRVKKHLEEHGWFCFRSAGSHSPTDLVCLRKGIKLALVLLIQCQTDSKFDKNKREGLIDLSIATGAFPLLCWRDGKKIQFELVEVK